MRIAALNQSSRLGSTNTQASQANEFVTKSNKSKQISFGLEIIPSLSDYIVDIVTEIVERFSDGIENIGEFFKKSKKIIK